MTGQGRFGRWRPATPGAANSGPRTPDVLVSEIFFDPISDDDRDEWLELHNPGAAAVDVGGWRFTDGIDFTVPAGHNDSRGRSAGHRARMPRARGRIILR